MNQGMVMYSDGGVRPINPGPAGWGIHGYLYSDEQPKKTISNFDHYLTNLGYVSKTNLKDNCEYVEVTPIHYIDGYGSVPFYTTNNVAELLATINSLRHAFEYDIKEVNVFTDSQYVQKGLELYADNWKKNGWIKQDGGIPANVEYWKELVEERDRLVSRGVKVKINWVKGHVEKSNDKTNNPHPYCLGNDLADKLATIGVIGSIQQNFKNHIEVTVADQYWKYDVNKHPFISNRRLYFNTIAEFNKPGEYYLGEHGKDDDMLGKKISDGAYAVVVLKTPDPMIELIRNYQSQLSNNSDAIMMIRLDQLYRMDTHREINRYGILAMEQPNKYRLDLSCLDKEPLTRELRPPKLAMRAVESVSDLSMRLKMYQDKCDQIFVTDITDKMYSVTTKQIKKNETTNIVRLKPEYNVGFASIKTEVMYMLNGESKLAPITLTLGIDLVDRNTLKRLESFSPKISIISWLESPELLRYATIIETEDDIGIWCGYYSNNYFIPSSSS